MEFCENVIDENELLDELPESCPELYSNEKQISEASKDDSGLEISDSVETLKENQNFEEISGETNDSIYTDNKSLPELVPLPSNSENYTMKSPNCKENDEEISIVDENLPQLQPLPESSSAEDTPNVGNLSRRSSTSSFIDSLLDKLRRNNSDSSGSEISPKKKDEESIHNSKSSDDDLLVEINNHVSYTKSSNPNMLPTPIVENQSISSAFVNSAKEYEEAIERNKRKVTSRYDDKCRMTKKSLPPRMVQPKLPTHIQNPRTLAQKRILLANNLNFYIIEQESKIFKQIQRKMNEKDLNYNLIDSFAEDDIPIKHGPWKALCWLRTEEGNFIQQFISVDGHSYKLCGSRGNHRNKFLPSQSSKPFPKKQKTSLRSVRCCEGGKIKKRFIDNLVNVDSIKKFIFEENLNPYKKLEIGLYNQLCSIKPRPLAKKIEHINKNRKLKECDEDSVFLGDYMKYKMPDIKLQVKPQTKVPLDAKAKQYLNEIIPYRDMNENWIKFSLSTLSTKDEEEKDENFEFSIPYVDGRDHILVREVLKRPENVDAAFTDRDSEIQWTFDEKCDKNDELEMEIVDIIKDLTNSVCINLNDDLFTKIDPDVRIVSTLAPIKAKQAIENIASASKNVKSDQSRKMLLELRRLNANVVKSDSSRVDDDEDIRRHALAHLAKDERELRPTVIVTESDTVLLPNKNTENRRQKRAPKRYSDYMHTETIDNHSKEVDFEPPKKVKPKELNDEPFKTRAQYVEPGMTHEEVKTLKEEIKKWIHVNVEVRKLENLENIQHWCMIHNLYKCSCKKTTTLHERFRMFVDQSDEVADENTDKPLVDDENSKDSVINIPDSQENSDADESMDIDDIPSIEQEKSQRVLPVEMDKHRKSVCESPNNIDLEEENKENAPKMEIINIAELVNGGIGPIYINIYDTKVNRLNPIFRSILNNKSALVYVDGLGYYLDMNRIDVMRLKFDNIRDELEHPVFIVQPKVHMPGEGGKIFGEFVNLLFKEDSELLLQIKDKFLLKEVAKIIEVVLQSVRRKIEAQIGCEPSDFVKEQLSLITRDRSNSNTSVSSADTSPLHFNGKRMECAPAPGIDTELMKEFNQIFSMRMQRLCAIIQSNATGLHPIGSFVNKFYIYKWKLLLKSYEEDFINIWQVKLLDESNNEYFHYVITSTSQPPIIENVDADRVVNVKNLPLNKTSVLIKMIILRIENGNTKNMTVLLYGCKGYFRICGILNSKENYFDGVMAKPTKNKHPRLTAKIQKIYNIWYGLKKAKVLKNGALQENSESVAEEKQPEYSKDPEKIAEDPEKIAEDSEMITEDTEKIAKEKIESAIEKLEREKEKIECRLEMQNHIQLNPEIVENNDENSVNGAKMEVEKQNIAEASKEKKGNVKESTYKWFLFNIADDFSDILIKQWKNYLSYNTIIGAINKAKKKRRTLRILGPLNSAKDTPKIFALPKAPLKFKNGEDTKMTDNYLLFGPYLRDSNSNLLLMQNVNGVMILRDEFEQYNNIKRTSRTRCLWIYANSLKCITDHYIECIQPNWMMPEECKNASDDSEVQNSPNLKSFEEQKQLKIASIVGGFRKVL